MSTWTVGKPGAVSREFCRPERQTTAFYWSGAENHTAPRVDYWTCSTRTCGHLRMQMADVTDAEGFARTTVSKLIRTTSTVDYGDVRSIDVDDLISEARELLWQLYLGWDPSQIASFTSYASFYLPKRLVRWWRRTYGKDGNKPLGRALSLDTPVRGDDGHEFDGGDVWSDSAQNGSGGSLRGVVAAGSGDAGAGSDAVLRELVIRVHRRTLGVEAGNGGQPPEGTAD